MGNTGVILIMSLFWIIYGLLGISGVQLIPSNFQGKSFEKQYKKDRGISWVMVGIPWLAAYFFIRSFPMPKIIHALILIVLAIPGLIYSGKKEAMYKKMAEEEAKAEKE